MMSETFLHTRSTFLLPYCNNFSGDTRGRNKRGPGSSRLLEIQEGSFSSKSGSPVAPYTCHDLDRG